MNLFSPIKLRSLELKNRIVLSPMQQYSSKNGIPSNWHLVHLGSRAVGGAGLIMTECTAVSEEGLATLSDVGIWNNEQKNAWKNIVDFVHEQDAKIGIQLWHAGGKGSLKHPNERMKPLSDDEGGWTVKSSSPTEMNGVIPQELTVDEIQELKEKFVNAAIRAVEAGFDTIELHAGHGYLFHQFYSAVINKRNDEYGGSLENRIRFLVETVGKVRREIPDGMPLLVRISAVDYLEIPDAWTLDDSLVLAKILKENGVDLITASGGGFANVSKDRVFPNYQVPFASTIKHQTVIATGAVGMITEAVQANDIIVNDDADLVFIAREHLRDPYFALHSAIELELDTEIPWQYKRAF
ncbi:NADH:flavin oxidoreductase/NADH oxidase [Chryseobacterium sp. BIGb0232]|uniref:NADH:flavin oxidoreductase/NADH oxidase n=1 Tax=Chryseobacterium sp. BIGb0232 TaxID=2940598 RepID=UPI000F486238|nr:NADH:flavin oxidoreductase/NADH oxidase [Chryseobacterium sp. BIGb0232]MCS4300920.1 2,4-dienoyl-CoA reductase-like NADH-dependent reductase (Old Yellow Enzyme family) [Chryseobacterium sp. BIGb0232]ROS20210.1 2,4-dienoyl-CoA reductase-like NADH-dependent reductase (Old Yellow Enzyme family) [Chryseobacterium nakagawai]